MLDLDFPFPLLGYVVRMPREGRRILHQASHLGCNVRFQNHFHRRLSLHGRLFPRQSRHPSSFLASNLLCVYVFHDELHTSGLNVLVIRLVYETGLVRDDDNLRVLDVDWSKVKFATMLGTCVMSSRLIAISGRCLKR